MANPSLRDLVNTALQNADYEMKTASRDSTDYIFGAPPPPVPEVKTAALTPAQGAVLSDAEYGLKLAEACDLAAELLKSAEALVVTPAGHLNETQEIPKARSVVNGIPSGVSQSGSAGSSSTAMNNTADDYTSPNDHSGTVKNDPSTKSAHNAVTAAKLAQAEMYRRIGNKTAADRIEAEVIKTAEQLDMGPSGSSMVPDAAALISMTRAQARDRTTAELRGVLSEPPKRDPAALAAVGHDAGLKMSSGGANLASDLRTEQIRAGLDMHKRQGKATRTQLKHLGVGALGGATLGGLIGHASGGHAGEGAAIGAALGMYGGLGTGIHSAVKNDKAHLTAQLAAREAKTSSVDPQAARAYLTKVAAILHDDAAPAAERIHAAQILQGLQEYAARVA